ncbi:hypothetical protein KP509_26G047900 [Ceratopteris richardii]|uniref:RING-type domain-containing protein n=1 Tax=Ceratopteris richardii TaxID=49495 RepID=A0A8T2RM12_CERRI|nr:hypothetical protein KP509_26G047900 [Ceratopteris richardii]
MAFLLSVSMDCFFTAWFLICSMWTSGEIGRRSGTFLTLCRLIILALMTLAVRWLVPLIICSTLYLCVPPLIRLMCAHQEFDEDLYNLDYKSRCCGATDDDINALPSHPHCASLPIGAFDSCFDPEFKESPSCCICLSRYEEGVVLRELPCSHTFHMTCIDKWLRMRATCPLCNLEIHRHGFVDDYFL